MSVDDPSVVGELHRRIVVRMSCLSQVVDYQHNKTMMVINIISNLVMM